MSVITQSYTLGIFGTAYPSNPRSDVEDYPLPPLIEFVDENRLLLYFPGDSVDI